jgi:hypothetical protein
MYDKQRQTQEEYRRRLFLGVKTKSLGCSDVRITSEFFGVDFKTIRKGTVELSEPANTPARYICRPGGEVKKTNSHFEEQYIIINNRL